MSGTEKTVVTIAICVVALIGVSASYSKQRSPNVVGAQTIEKLKAREVSIIDDEGREMIRLSGSHGTHGIWVNGKDSNQFAAIYCTGHNSPVIAIADTSGKNPGFQFGLTLDANGDPYVQVFDGNGKIKHITADKLKKMAE